MSNNETAVLIDELLSVLVQVGNEVIDGKLTNQVIIRTHKMNIQVFMV